MRVRSVLSIMQISLQCSRIAAVVWAGKRGYIPKLLMSLLKLTVLQTPLARSAPGRTEVGLLRFSLRPAHLLSAKSFDIQDGSMNEPFLYAKMGETVTLTTYFVHSFFIHRLFLCCHEIHCKSHMIGAGIFIKGVIM
jgi:hypothetical protein